MRRPLNFAVVRGGMNVTFACSFGHGLGQSQETTCDARAINTSDVIVKGKVQSSCY
jgi:hypothetical protein